MRKCVLHAKCIGGFSVVESIYKFWVYLLGMKFTVVTDRNLLKVTVAISSLQDGA